MSFDERETKRDEHAARRGNVLLSREQMSERSGCQCKLPGMELNVLLSSAFATARPRPNGQLLWDRPEDCALLSTTAGQLLATCDFGPLVGPDLNRAGRIAALHAMSDVYAMGGVPKWALTLLVVDPSLPRSSGAAVQSGIVKACGEEGVEVMGGQTVEGAEAMAGLTVIGEADVRGMLRKVGARPGDVLLLSKPVGVGLIVRSYKLALIDDDALETALAVMDRSNGAAARAAMEVGVNAATDVTGFGLLGHLVEMLQPENLGAVIDLGRVPVLEAATEVPAVVTQTRWIAGNLEYARSKRRLDVPGLSDGLASLLDPQTNGGLLVAAHPSRVSDLERAGYTAIGDVAATNTVEVRR